MTKARSTAPHPSKPTQPVQPERSQHNRLLARIAGGVGGVGVLVAIILFLAQQAIDAPVFIAAIIGLGGPSIWLSLAPDDLHQMFTPRRAAYGGSSLLNTGLVVAIAVVVYGVSATLNVNADLTEYRYYTLRPDVAALIQSLDKPVMITAFYTTAQLDQQASEQPILNLFRDAGHGQVLINVVDPDTQPTVAQAFGARSGAHAFVTAVTADGKPDTTAGRIVALTNDYVGEQQIADAILLLTMRGKFTVLFSIGHGEVNTDSASRGIATEIRAGLEKIGIHTDTIDLSKQDIPTQTTAVVLLAPHQDFTDAETARVAGYLSNGGSVLIMASPPLYQYTNAPTATVEYTFLQAGGPLNTYLWQTWGIRPQNDIVYDPGSYVDSPYHTLTAQASNHPIMQQDSAGTRLRALLYLPRSWETAVQSAAPKNVQIDPLILTSNKAYGATDIRQVQFNPDTYKHTAADLPGPLTLAVAASNSINHSHLVVIGDYQWAEDQVVEQYGNALFWSNAMNWLTSYDQRTTVSPTATLLPLIATSATLNTVAVLTLLALPGTVLVVGAIVWWARNRR